MPKKDSGGDAEQPTTDQADTPTTEREQEDGNTHVNEETSDPPSGHETDSESPKQQVDDTPDETNEDGSTQQDRAELEEKVIQMEERIDELETLLEDYQRRNEHEHEELRKYAVEEFAEEMLKVKDSLQNAIEMEDLDEGTEQRLTVVVRQFDNIFTSGSIDKIDPEPGEEFDDSLHRMIDKEASDSQETESIVEVLEVGYEISDRVIRPARVVVAK